MKLPEAIALMLEGKVMVDRFNDRYRIAMEDNQLCALEWLDDDPRRVVSDLLQQVQRLQRSAPRRAAGRRTRSDHRYTDRAQADAGTHQRNTRNQKRQQTPNTPPASAPPGTDPRYVAALATLGLEWGASRDAIKQAHRRLVKQHHPDMGGRPEDFHRVNDAYQLLVFDTKAVCM